MKLGELSKDVCLDCGKGYDFCTCEKTYTPPRYDEVYYDAIEAMDKEGEFVLPDHPVVIAQNKQAFDLLYDTLQEVREIVHRGIRDGTKGHKRALLKAQEKLREIG